MSELLSKEDAIAKVVEINRTEYKNIDRKVAALEAVAAESDMSKAELATKADQVIAGEDKAAVTCSVGEFGCSIAAAKPEPKIATAVAQEPLEDSQIVTSNSNGRVSLKGLSPDTDYMVVSVPKDVQVNVQPPCLIAGGAKRKVAVLTAEYRVGVETENKAPAASEDAEVPEGTDDGARVTTDVTEPPTGD